MPRCPSLLALALCCAGVATAQSDRSIPLGGPATTPDRSPNAFGFPVPTLDAAERRAFSVGNSFFRLNWVAAPASSSARDGLGPLFNAASCSTCHPKDGRGAPPAAFQGAEGLLVRLGIATENGPDRAHPIYGGQLQDRAVRGRAGEARVRIDHEAVHGEYGDGTPFTLSKPIYRFEDWADGEPGPGLVIGPRVGQQLIGVGLLDSVPAEDLLRTLFGLTRAEIALTEKLANGQTLTEAAEAARISRETARTHLKSILRKTGTRRQSELTALLAGLTVVRPG